jgi:hypothetical protein
LVDTARSNAVPSFDAAIEFNGLVQEINRSIKMTDRSLITRLVFTNRADAAIRHLLDGTARGKIVVSVFPGPAPAPTTGSTP